MSEIITLGETMATLTPKGTGYLHYIKDYEMRIAGAESNLAIGVCKLGHSASWISSLGNDELGYFVNNNIRAEGVDTHFVKFDSQHRTGVMFKQVLPGKETSVFYYRENSAAANMQAEDLSEEMFAGGKILHLNREFRPAQAVKSDFSQRGEVRQCVSYMFRQRRKTFRQIPRMVFQRTKTCGRRNLSR